jgi:putative ABC transport system permease protein
VTLPEGGPSGRIFAALIRACPEHVRTRFGAGMKYAFGRDLAAARAQGRRALTAFWIVTIADMLQLAIRERTRGERSVRGSLTIDWRDAWRSLRATPLVTAFAVVSLALGIGGVTALFSILNSLALKPLAVREPQRLVLLGVVPQTNGGSGDSSWTNPIWEAVRERHAQFADGAFAWATDRFNLSSTATSDIVEGLWVSGGLFDVLGVSPALGRTISGADDVRGGGADGAVAVIGYGFWQRRFGGAPDVVGRTLTIERVPFTIVGVTPPRFFGPDVGRAFDVAIPLGTEPLVRPRDHALDGRSVWWMNIMARLKPELTPEQATAQLQSLQPAIREATMPAGRSADDRARYLADPFALVSAPEGRSPLRRQYEEPLTAILWVAGLVLLIACANIANLLIARASTRRHELTLRLALGASRFRLARQLLAESTILACAGAALGVLLAGWGSRALIAQLTTFAASVQLDLGLDWRVVGFTTAVSAGAVVLFGVAPALSVSRLSPNEALKEQGRSGLLERRGLVRQASVILQVALSLALVVGAGLFTRTFGALATRDAGFTRDGVLLVTANLDRNPAEGAARIGLFERFGNAARIVPGVRSVAVSYTTPLARAGMNTMIAVPAGSTLSRRERMSWVNAVSPGWFATFGLRLSAGRDFDERDRAGAPFVAVVNRAFVRRFLNGAPALGARFSTAGPGPGSGNPVYEIVGVVEDAVYRSLRAPMEPTMYLPLGQWDGPPPFVTIAVRAAAGPPSNLAHAVAAEIGRQDPTAVLSFRLLDEQVNASMTQERLVAMLAGFFGVLGLLLAAVGLYGVTSYAVTSRRAEIGIRMALGASAKGVVAMVLRRVAWLVGLGIVIGACLSAWAATFVRTLLYGLDARDPMTFAGAAVLLMAVAALAAWLPARRASRIDPMRVLRNS